jgi:predicted RNA-binding Zn ribbon-like protein
MPTSLRFPLLGEPLALDLVNTRVRERGVDRDLLAEPPALAAWLAAEAARLPWSGRVAAADLQAVRTLRDAIAALLTARHAGARPSRAALGIVNAALSMPAPPTRLAWTAAGPRTRRQPAAEQRDALLHALAMDAVDILTGPDAELLRSCANPNCVLQFLARDPRRRWCSAAVCGNRARVSRHYFRYRTDR